MVTRRPEGSGDGVSPGYEAAAILATFPDGVLIQDETGRIVYANDAAARQFGYTPGELIGSDFSLLIAEPLADLLGHFNTSTPKDVGLNRLVKGIRKDGSAFQASFAIGETTAGGKRLFTWSIRDLSDFQASEQALGQGEDLFRLAALATDEVLWVWDIESGWMQWHDDLHRAFGHRVSGTVTPEDWWQQHIHEEDLGRVMSTLQAACRYGRERWDAECRFRKADRTYATVVARGYFVKDRKGRAVRMIGAMQDVTRQRELEESLRESNATLERRVEQRTAELEGLTQSLRMLASNLSQTEQSERKRLAQMIHDDLQQLLVAARMQVSQLQGAKGDATFASSQQFAVSLLDKAIEEARSLTTQLRPPALYEDGLVSALEWLAGWMARAHGLKVELDLDKSAGRLPEHVTVFLFDAVRELLLNVVKHAEVDTAAMRVKRDEDGALRITVSDAGSGFDPKLLKTPETVGGFGLFSIRERLLAIGGRLEVQSARGKGTVFDLIWHADAPGFSADGTAPRQGPAAQAG